MPRKAVHEHELTYLSTDDFDRLLESQPASKTAGPTFNTRIRDFLRHVRLLLPGVLVGRAFLWMSPIEQRKVAAYQSRRMAILNSLLHLIPLSGAAVLLVLFWTKHWVGGASDNATTLQFIAKFHELLMQSSLVDILLYIIRAQALGGYIPLGVLSGAAQAPQISYLWSLDFVSAISSPQFGMWRKIVFSISAIAILSMASVVGPSSAVLMIPRPDMTHVRSAETYDTNVPESLVFPTRLDSSQNMSFSKFDYLERIRPYEDGYVWQLGVNQRRRPIDELVMSTSGLPSYSENSYIVSLPTNLAGDQALEKFMQSLWIGTNDEVSAVINTYQPLVSYICHEFDSSRDGWTYYTMRNGSVDRLKPISELNMQFMRYEGYLYAAPIWIAAPDNPASLIVVLAGKYEESSSYFGSICTISSYWWHTDAFLKVIPDPPRFRLSVKRPDPDLTDTGATRMTSNLRPITVDASNIESLNSVDLTYKIQSNLDFAFLWVAALAQVPRQQPGEIRDTISDGKSHMSDSQDNASNASYTVTTLFHGFGYGSTDTPSKLSAAVITAYCLISLLFVAYIITTGHTSIAWDSAMELIVLALQSKEPDSLGHISVGLDSMDTFRKTVGIRVNTVPVGDTGETRERLELIFEHDEDTEKRGLTEVVRNRAY